MAGGGDHQHDPLARAECAPWRWMMVSACSGQRRERLLGDAGDLRLRHARIMLELQRRERPVLVAAEAGEGDDRADVAAAVLDQRGLMGRIEGGGLDAESRGSSSSWIRARTESRAMRWLR